MEDTWLDEAKRTAVLFAARQIGLPVRGRRFACPNCGGEGNRRDPRPRAGVTRDGYGWRCHCCGAGGSTLDLASLAVLRRHPSERDFHVDGEVHRACASLGLCTLPSHPTRARAEVELLPTPAAAEPVTQTIQARRPRLQQAELEALWAACLSVLEDAEVSGWLRERGFDGDRRERIEAFDLARALPPDLPLPPWARCRGKPWHAGWRCIVPMYDSRGRLGALQARATRALDPKSVNPIGGSPHGTVMACPLARLWLAGGFLGDGTPATELVARVGLVLAEGVPDFLTWATRLSDAREDAPATVGIVAGSWTPEFASRVPDRCCVTVATHPDAQGDKYAEMILDTLAERVRAGAVRVRRWTSPTKP